MAWWGEARRMVVGEAEACGSGLHAITMLVGRSLVTLLLIKPSRHHLRRLNLLNGSGLKLTYDLSGCRP